MQEKLAAAIELDRQLRLRAVSEVHAIAGGFVIRDPELPDVFHMNAVLLSGCLAAEIDADAVQGLAERWLSDRGHRQVVIDDAEAGERLAPDLTERGWERMRTLYMAFSGDPSTAAQDPRAREISESELHAVQLANMKLEYPAGRFSPGLPGRLAAAQAALRAATRARCFGVGEAGQLQSTSTLFLDPAGADGRVAMIEEVATLPEYRERGLARAVVSAAIRAAGEREAELIVVPADADDWPQMLYAKLGFEPVGRQVTFIRRPPRYSVSGGV